MLSHLLTALLSIILLQTNPTVSWNAVLKHLEGENYELILSGKVAPGHYVHPAGVKYSGTELKVEEAEGVELKGELREEFTPSDYKGEVVVEGDYILRQGLRIKSAGSAGKHDSSTANNSAGSSVSGTVSWSACSGDECGRREDYDFSLPLPSKASGSLWGLILEAILWGLLMLLTPCVFPMVPMTVSFFLKQSSSPARGRFNALAYGLFIVLLYTLPICIIIGITRLAGGATVTADIFNWLSTHWLPNLIFFVIFMLFAASFFGAFELTLPSKWATKADQGSNKGGLAGVFFLALTLVLVSFSCTGPIVGTVLIKSTQGEFWVPMVTMLAFSTAFALPFALLAFFPSMLDRLPRSGGWLNSVKVVLGFVELALGLKFLSVADQTYHWHLLDREVYLAIWIVIFTLLGLYLLGKLRFKYDSPLEYISLGRLALAIADFAFVVYLIPGMWGAPLKALSGYLPPMETQDFVLGRYAEPSVPESGLPSGTISLPHSLSGYTSLDKALEEASEQGKKVFVDISGHGCVNCREMEARVWSDPEVLERLREDFVILALYVDDKTRLPESQWITTSSGKVLKDIGRVNSQLVYERFGVNSQPNYLILDPEGNILAGPYSYNLSVSDFLNFLKL